MGLFQWIKNFTNPPKSETYLTQLPEFTSVQELVDFIETKHQQENAQLKAENVRLSKKFESQQQKKKKEEDYALLEHVQGKKLEAEQIEKELTLKFELKGIGKKGLMSKEDYPTFFLKSNKAIGKFRGVMLRETNEGYLLWYPWIKVGKDDLKFEKHAYRFEDFFKQTDGIISQMRGGKLDSNFDINQDGRPILLANVIDKPKGTPATVDEINKVIEETKISDQQKREYEHKIADLTSGYQHVHSKYTDLLKEIEETNKKNADLEVESQVASKDRDLYAAAIAVEAKKAESTTQVVMNALTTIQDLKVAQVLEARQSETINNSLTRLRKKYSEGLYRDEREIEESKEKDLARSVAAEVTRAFPVQKIVQPAAPTPP